MNLFLNTGLLLSIASLAVVNAQSTIYQLHGSGTTNPSKCYWSIMETLHEQAGVPVRLSYRAVGSSTGIAEFQQGYTESLPTVFGSGDIPIPKEVYDTISGKGVIHLPVLAGAVSFFHSLPGNPALNLTACIIGQMYTGAITSWGDQQVLNINPNLSSEAKNLDVTVARRVKGSSSTASATAYLFGACDNDDERIPTEMAATLPDWDNLQTNEKILACEGSGGVTSCIVDNPGTIGYIDAGHGVSAGLNEVRLHNKDSNVYRTSQESSIQDAITLAAMPDSPDGDFSQTSFLNRGGENTWPIVLMSYIYIQKDLSSYITNPEEQTLLIAFLRSLYDDEYIQLCADEFGFTTLSGIADVKAFAEGAIDSLAATVSDNATAWFFETSTTAGQGAQPFVFSVKRRQIADIQIAALEGSVEEFDEKIASLDTVQADLAALKSSVTQAEQDISDVKAGTSSSTNLAANGSGLVLSDQQETQLKAALILSSLSFVMWMIWGAFAIYKAMGGGKIPNTDSVV